MVQYITSFFSALNKNSNPGDIAHGVAIGAMLAIMPKNNLLWWLIFIFILFIRINKGAFFLSFILLGFITPFFDVLIDKLGFFVLSISFMQGLYTHLDIIPFVGLTRFYNTMVTGGVVFGLILYIPIYLSIKFLIYKYRSSIRQLFDKFHESVFAPILNKIPFLRHISKLGKAKELFDK